MGTTHYSYKSHPDYHLETNNCTSENIIVYLTRGKKILVKEWIDWIMQLKYVIPPPNEVIPYTVIKILQRWYYVFIWWSM